MKYRGERPLYDAAGNVRDHASLDASELIEGILCWSALPGASRHHWGTDIDVVDRAAMPEGYRYKLVPEEYAAGGVFDALNVWLDANIARFGFYRPYAEYRGGVHPEPWHLSFAPVASAALALLTPDLIASDRARQRRRGGRGSGARAPARHLPHLRREYFPYTGRDTSGADVIASAAGETCASRRSRQSV